MFRFRALMEMIEIDGSVLEGGGQILRNCVAYSAVLNKPVKISNIRGNRPKPGLQLQHLTGLKLAAGLASAETTGLEKNSSEISFVPRGINHGSFEARIPSAGACTLMVQVSLPIALFAEDATTLVLKGGTNVPFSPPAEYLPRVLFPTLRRFGVEGLELEVVRKGFMPAGGGELRVRVQPVKSLTNAELNDRGGVKSCTAILTGFCTDSFEKEVEGSISGLQTSWKGGDIERVFTTERSSKDKGSVQLLFVVETENEYRIGASAIGGRKTSGEKLVKDAFERLCKQLEKGLCVDEYLQDQLIIFMALAHGTSSMRCGEITLHTQTAMHFASLMTGATFHVQQVEPGVNFISCCGASLQSQQ